MKPDDSVNKQTQIIKNRIAKIEEKEKQLKARKRAELNRLNQQKRKQRTGNRPLVLDYQRLKNFAAHVTYDDGTSVLDHYHTYQAKQNHQQS